MQSDCQLHLNTNKVSFLGRFEHEFSVIITALFCSMAIPAGIHWMLQKVNCTLGTRTPPTSKVLHFLRKWYVLLLVKGYNVF